MTATTMLMCVGSFGNRTFFSMEWLSLGELADRLCGGPLPPREAVLLVAKLSDAIHHAPDARYTGTLPLVSGGVLVI